MSCGDRMRCGEGRRALRPLSEAGSEEKLTSSSGSAASDRTATDTARLKGSLGDSGFMPMFHPALEGGGSDSVPTSKFAQQISGRGNGTLKRTPPRKTLALRVSDFST